jgi:hypothetical protein
MEESISLTLSVNGTVILQLVIVNEVCVYGMESADSGPVPPTICCEHGKTECLNPLSDRFKQVTLHCLMCFYLDIPNMLFPLGNLFSESVRNRPGNYISYVLHRQCSLQTLLADSSQNL